MNATPKFNMNHLLLPVTVWCNRLDTIVRASAVCGLVALGMLTTAPVRGQTVSVVAQGTDALQITVNPQGHPVFGIYVFGNVSGILYGMGTPFTTGWPAAGGGTTTNTINYAWTLPFFAWEPYYSVHSDGNYTVQVVGPGPDYPVLTETRVTPSGNSSTTLPRLGMEYWQADDHPDYSTGQGHFEPQDYWVDDGGYWEDQGYYELRDGMVSYWDEELGDWVSAYQVWYEWIPNMVWISQGHTETQWIWVEDTYPNGLFGSSWTTTVGTYNVPNGQGEYSGGGTNRGLPTFIYLPGQVFSFRAWGGALPAVCNNFRVRAYNPSGNLIVNGPFSANSFWGGSINLDGTGLFKIEVSYENAIGITPANGTVTYHVVVGGAPQSIDFPPIPSRGFADAPFTLAAVASSGLPVSYAIASGAATISGNKVTLTGYGSVTVTASQSGDTNFAAAPNASQSFFVSPVTITGHPVATVADPGRSLDLSVTAIGAPGLGALSYQWRRNGVALAGATSATLTIPAVQSSDEGAYSAAVNGRGNVVISREASVAMASSSMMAVQSQSTSVFGPGAFVIAVAINFDGQPDALGWRVTLPPGWNYVSSSGVNVPQVNPAPGATGTLGWSWSNRPPGPVTFTYTVNVPAGASGSFEIPGDATLSMNGMQSKIMAAPLLLGQGFVAKASMPAPVLPIAALVPSVHSTDLDRDYLMSLTDLNRLLELYNTRYGSVRTGRYKVEAGTADGFNRDSATPIGATVTLSAYHSADTNSDGRFSLVEMTRVIELYNTRAGTVRTGEYHVLAGTEDGYHIGPGPSAPPRIAGQTQAQTVVQGSSVTLEATVVGTPPFTYQWKRNDVAISGATSASLTLTNVQAVNAGSYVLTATNSFGSAASNGAMLTVKMPPVISSATSASGTYGSQFSYSIIGSNGPTGFSASPLPAGLSFNPSSGLISGTPTTSGQFTILLGATNADGAGTAVLTLTIAKAQLTVAADNKSKVYGATLPALTATLSGFVNGETLGSSGVTGNAAVTTTATAGSSVGSYTMTAAAGTLSAANYAFNFAPGTLTVSKAPLTVTANNLSRVYGAANPSFTATYTGLVGPDTAAVVSGLTFGSLATAVSNVGSYAVTPAGGTAANYLLSYIAGQLTITKASQTITFGALAGKTYGDPPVALIATASSSLAVSYASSNASVATVSGSTVTIVGAGTTTITASQTGDSNYFPATSVLQVLTVNKAAASVVLGGLAATFDNTAHAATATTIPAGLAVTFSYDGSPTAPTTAGSYVVVGTITHSNYQGTATGTLVISLPPAPAITTQPFSATLNPGNFGTFTVGATGTPPLTYQWRKNGTPISGTLNASANAATLNLGQVQASDAGSYDVIVANFGGSVTSSAAALAVNLPPAITSATSVNSTMNNNFAYVIAATNSPSSFGASGLPSGLTISTSSGLVSGNFAQTGSFPVQISATNSAGTTSTTLTITVAAAPNGGTSGPPDITISSFWGGKNSLIDGTSLKIVASNSPTSYGATGLPPGVTLDGATGVLSGTPTQSGVFAIAVTATNEFGMASANGQFFVADERLNLRAGETRRVRKIWSGLNVPEASSFIRWHLRPPPRYSAIAHEPPTIDPAPGELPLLEPHPFDTWSLLVVTPMAPGFHGAEIWTSTDPNGTPPLTASHYVAFNVADFNLSSGDSTFDLPGDLTAGGLRINSQNWALENTGNNLNAADGFLWGGQKGFDLKARESWKNGNAGSPTIVVLVLDCGVEENHPGLNIPSSFSRNFGSDLGPNPFGWADRTRGESEIHGTLVAGCVAGLFANPAHPFYGQAFGVAPGVQIASARVGSNYQLNSTFQMSPHALANAMDWGVYEKGARISVSAFSNSHYSEAMEAAFEDARRLNAYEEVIRTGPYAGTAQKGVIHFVSSGNYNLTSMQYPALLSYVNAVGAVTGIGNAETGEGVRWHIPASFRVNPADPALLNTPLEVWGSNRGSGLDFVAPGHQIITLRPTWLLEQPGSTTLTSGVSHYGQNRGWDYYGDNDKNNRWNRRYASSGTSFAAPFAAGVAALILSQNPSWTAAAVETRMQKTAQRIPANSGYNTDFGWGMVDARAATKAGDWNTLNLSTLGRINEAGQAVVMGFTVGGTAPKRVLVRAIGPTLASYVASGVLATPTITVTKLSNNEVMGTNTGWSNAPNNTTPEKLAELRQVSAGYAALPIPDSSADCALLLTLPAGGYTATITGAGGATGYVLAEIYDTSGSAVDAQFDNLSTASQVAPGNTMVGGFVVKGNSPRSVLIRAVGPSLLDLGVSDFLSDPQLRVLKQSNTAGEPSVLVAENDNWQAQPNWSSVRGFATEVGAFALRSNSKDAAVLLELEPNSSYTVEVTGVGGTPGVALVEVYPARN